MSYRDFLIANMPLMRPQEGPPVPAQMTDPRLIRRAQGNTPIVAAVIAQAIANQRRPTMPNNEQALHGYAVQDRRIHGQPYDPAEAARRFSAYRASQTQPTGYGGSTPGAVPVTPQEAALNVHPGIDPRIIRRMQENQPVAPYPAYDVAGAPGENRTGGTPQEQWQFAHGRTEAIPTGAMPLTADQPVVEQPPVRPPSIQDIKFFEENTELPSGQMPLTPEEKAAADKERKAQEETAYADSLKATILQPGTIENSAYQDQIDNGATPDEAMQAVFDFYYAPPSGAPDVNLETVAPALNLLDKGRQWNVNKMGDAAYDVATGKADKWDPGIAALTPGNWMIPGLDATRFNQDFQKWVEDPRNWQRIRYAYENGFQATNTDPRYMGGRAVWELFINSAGGMYKFVADIVNDPTILLASGKAIGDPLIESATRGAADENLVTNILKRTAGQALSAPQNVMNATVDAPFNILGHWIGQTIGHKRVVGGTLLEEPAYVRATEQVNLADEAMRQQDRIRGQGLGPDDLHGDGLPSADYEPPSDYGPSGSSIPPDAPKYTKVREGDQWVIRDPQGNAVETMKYEPQRTGAREDSYPNRLAQRRVNELNAPIVRKEEIARGGVFPPNSAGLTWTSPSYDRITNRGRDMPGTIQERVAYDNSLPQSARRAWMEEWAPKAKEHEAVMADFDRANETMVRKAGGSLERDFVQQGKRVHTPAQTFEQIRFEVEDTLLPFMKAFPGTPQRARPWITTPDLVRDANGQIVEANDVNALIEHAVLGTRDDAIRAREILHRRNVKIDGFSSPNAFIERLGNMGEEINGPGWRSEQLSAAQKRAQRGQAAGQQSIDDAAVAELVGRPEKRSIAERTRRINQGYGRQADASVPTVAMGQNLAELNALATTPDKITTQLSLDVSDRELAREISNPTTSTVTPANNRIEAPVPGEVRVRQAGAIRQKSVRITKKRATYDVTARAGDRPYPVPTLNQAIAVADELLARAGKGIDPVPAQVKRVLDEIVPPNGYTYSTTPISTIKTETASFQNRKAPYSEQSVQNILANFDVRKFEPIEVRVNPDGTFTVLSGHSRLEAWLRLVAEGHASPDEVPIRIQHGTERELRLLAQTSNTRGTGNTPTEQGRLLRNLTEDGLSWADAIREVNVNSADGRRLQFLTNLNNGLQDDVDAGRLPVKQGAMLGESIEKGVITPVDADALFLDKISKEGMSDIELRNMLEAAAIVKANRNITQGDMFGDFSIMSMAVKDSAELVRVQKALAREESLLSRASRSTNIDPETQTGLGRAVRKLQKDLADVLARINGSLYAINPPVARNLNAESGVREDILRKIGAYEGPGGSDASRLSKTDRSYVGAGHQMGKIDDATYLKLNQWVVWERQPMKMWEAYDRALDWYPDPLEAKQVIARAAVDADIKAAIDAGKVAVEDRGAAKRAAYKALTAYQTVLAFEREAIMFNWARGFAGAFADAVGTNYSLIINNEYRAALKNMNPLGAVRHFIQDERGKGLAIDNLPGMDRYKYLTGTEPPPSVLQLVETRFETAHDGLVLERAGGLYNLLRPIADKDIKAFRVALDRNSRFSLHMSSFDNNIKHAQNQFRGIVATRARRTGNDYVEWLRILDQAGNDYNPDDVFRLFGDERLARDWRELISKSRLDAKERVNQVLFSYKQTNLDNALRNVIFFHYWMSRALPMHAKVAFKNPWLLNAYSRAWGYMEREAEQNNYPPSVRGFIRMMGDESGFYGLLNPLQVLVPFAMLVDSNDDPGVFAFLKRWGLFVNPLIEAAAASLGWTNTLPDVTSTLAIRRAARYTVNWLNSNGFDRIVPDILGGKNTWQPSVVDEAEYQIIERINSYAQRVGDTLAPSQNFISDYEGSSRNAYEYDQLNSVLINELEKKYGPFAEWTPDSPAFDDYLAAMDDIKSGRDGNVLADTVVEIMADAKLENAALASVTPGGVYQRYGPRDQTLAEKNDGEQQAVDQRTLATSGSTADAKLDILGDRYQAIGTSFQKAISRGYNDISNPKIGTGNYDLLPNATVTIHGKTYTAASIAALDDDQRKALADLWVAENKGTAELKAYWDERDRFVSANPEFGTFKEYQDIAYNYAGGPHQFRLDRAAGNPNFKRAMEDQRTFLVDVKKIDPKLVEAELDAWAPTLAAYKASAGIQDSIYDPTPISTGDQSTVDSIVRSVGSRGGTGGSSTGYTKKTTAAKLAGDLARYDEDLAVVSDLLTSYGIDPALLDSHEPYVVDTINRLVGSILPAETALMKSYHLWAEIQRREGTDDSVDAFGAYLDRLKERAAAA